MAARLRLVFDGGAGTLGRSVPPNASSSTRVRPLIGTLGTRRTAGTVHAQVALEHEALSLRTHANVAHQDRNLRGRHAHGAKGAGHDAALAADAVVLVNADAMVLFGSKNKAPVWTGLRARASLVVAATRWRGDRTYASMRRRSAAMLPGMSCASMHAAMQV